MQDTGKAFRKGLEEGRGLKEFTFDQTRESRLYEVVLRSTVLP